MATAEDILDLKNGVSVRADRFRHDLLDSSGTKIGEVDVREDQPSTIRNNSNAAVMRTLRLNLSPGEYSSINPITDRIRPTMILQNGDEYPLGVYLIADESGVEHQRTDLSTTIAVDQGLILNQPRPNSFGAAPGEDAAQLVTGLLSEAGFATVDVRIAGKIGAPIGFRPGHTAAEVINDISALVGGYRVYFTNAGIPTVRPVEATDAPTLFYTKDAPRVVQASTVTSNDLLDAPNRFIVIGQSSSSPAVGVYDVPDAAPHSARNRGFVVSRTMSVQGIRSQVAAQLRALAWAKQTQARYEFLSMQTPIDPRHETFDIVLIDRPNGDQQVWREQYWSMELKSGGLMEHELTRSYDS